MKYEVLICRDAYKNPSVFVRILWIRILQNPSVFESKNQSFMNIWIRNKFGLNKHEKLQSRQNKWFQ